MKIRKFIPLVVYMLVLFLVFSWTGNLFGNASSLSYSQVVELFRQEQVKSFVVSDNTIQLELHNPYNGETRVAANMADPESFRAELHELFREQTDAGILERYDFIPEKGFSPYQLIFPSILICITMLCFTLIGDALRDALDPKGRR